MDLEAAPSASFGADSGTVQVISGTRCQPVLPWAS